MLRFVLGTCNFTLKRWLKVNPDFCFCLVIALHVQTLRKHTILTLPLPSLRLCGGGVSLN